MGRRKARLSCGWLSVWLVGCSALVGADPEAVPSFEDDGGSGADGGGSQQDGGADGAPMNDGGGGGAMDGGVSCAGDCDDGVACTVDECVSGVCRSRPDDARCGAGERCHIMRGCVPTGMCRNDDDCDNGSYCDGQERCAPGEPGANPVTGCVSGDPPVCGAPEGSCLVGVCDDASGGCTMGRDPSLCDDMNPCTADACGGDDMCRHEPVDADADGFPAAEVGGMACGVPRDTADCDDTDPSVHPGAEDVCNGVDDDCDGVVDEDCPTPDTCGDAVRITVPVGGRDTVYGTFRGRTSQAGSFCANTGSPDAFYVLQIGGGATGLVDIELDTIGSGADTVLAIRNDGRCGMLFPSACHDDRIPSAGDLDAKIWVHNWPANRELWILVEKAGGRAADDFRLNVHVRSAAGDQCGAPPIDISGGGVLAGYVGGPAMGGDGGPLPPVFVGRYEGSCGGHGKAEVLARFTARYDRQGFTTWSIDFSPITYVRTACSDGDSEEACSTGTWMTSFFRSRLRTELDRGDRGYLFVDGADRGDWFVSLYEPGG